MHISGFSSNASAHVDHLDRHRLHLVRHAAGGGRPARHRDHRDPGRPEQAQDHRGRGRHRQRHRGSADHPDRAAEDHPQGAEFGRLGSLLGSFGSFSFSLPKGVPASLRISHLTLNSQGLTVSAVASNADAEPVTAAGTGNTARAPQQDAGPGPPRCRYKRRSDPEHPRPEHRGEPRERLPAACPVPARQRRRVARAAAGQRPAGDGRGELAAPAAYGQAGYGAGGLRRHPPGRRRRRRRHRGLIALLVVLVLIVVVRGRRGPGRPVLRRRTGSRSRSRRQASSAPSRRSASRGGRS